MKNTDKRTMRRRIVQILALALALLLAGGAVISALISVWAEEAPPRDSCQLTIQLLEEAQALQVTQRLLYTNRAEKSLDRALFCLYGNLYRRQSALEGVWEDLTALLPQGYAPGSVEFREVRVDGAAADWAVQGEEELFLRVGCDLAPGAQAVFEFEFTVLYTVNDGLMGAGETDLRFGGFYPVPALGAEGEFVLNPPLGFTRSLFAPALDYAADILLPEGYELACGGAAERLDAGDGLVRWHVETTAHEFAFAAGRRWRVCEGEAPSGAAIRVLSNARLGARRALACALEAAAQYEAWFGPLPGDVTIAQSDALSGWTYEGLILLPEGLFAGGAVALKKEIRCRLAQQYFGLAAYADPVADSWIGDAVSLYAAYLAQEEAEGVQAFLNALNRDIVPALQVTMPGGLRVDSAASLFTAREYQVIVLDRGAAVLHELRSAMGRETLIEALRVFVEMGRNRDVLTRSDFIAALDAASGGSWAAFLEDWLANVGDYVQQGIDWLE